MRFAITLTAAVFLGNAAWAETIPVDIKSFKYHEATITIAVGDTVIWLNQDRARHTATARDGSFTTGTLKKGASGEVLFSEAGTYEYVCKFHRNMKGIVVVK
jgi:plastocyanin